MDLLNIGLALVLVAANGFFVATEFAVARLARARSRSGRARTAPREVAGVRFSVLASADAQIQELRLLGSADDDRPPARAA